jgi:hypothetical protein
MGHEKNSGEQVLDGYAKQHGYRAQFEPDWSAKFGRSFTKNPDFLLARNGTEAITEVRDFTARPLEDHFGPRFGGSIDPAVLRKPLYRGIAEKAEQLAEFANTGLPLVIALTSTATAQIDLSRHEIEATMFGEIGVAMPLDVEAGELDASAAQHISEPGYGVFRGTDESGDELNRWPHISGVAVLARFDRNREFVSAYLHEYVTSRNPADRAQERALAAEWAVTAAEQAAAEGPKGFDHAITYYDLSGYALGAGPSVPVDWFDGPRDLRFGFEAGGRTFGPIPLAPMEGV